MMNVQSVEMKPNTSLEDDWLKSELVQLPFFDEKHRDIAERLFAWGLKNQSEIDDALLLSPHEAVRQLIRLLGDGGWFVTVLREEVDIRAVCIIRDILAHKHDLLDYAFSIQMLATLPFVLAGNEQQRSEILPKLFSGEEVAAFALTEKESGSNISKIAMEVSEVEGGRFKLNGKKHWIANADIADHISVLARTAPGPLGLSFFVVPTNLESVSTQTIDFIAPRPFADITFTDCLLPETSVLGERGMGLAVAIETLERCRITVGAAANGFARRAFNEAFNHILGRGKLSEIPQVKQVLADMAAKLNTSQLAVGQAAWEMDRDGEQKGPLSSLAKLQTTEYAQQVVDHCVQLHGAAGMVPGSVPEALYRQVRSLRVYEGASEVQTAIWTAAVMAGGLR